MDAVTLGLAQADAKRRYPITAKGIYVPAGWGEFWRPKRDAAATGGKATVAYMGDSIANYFTSSFKTKTIPARIAAALQPKYGDGGSGYFTVGNSKVHLSGLGSGYDSLFMQTTGTWASSNVNDGPAGRGIQSVTDGSTATWTVRGTKVGIVYLTQGSGGGTFTVAIDGGSPVTVNTTTGAAGLSRYEVTGLAAGDHTVLVTKTGTARADLFGFYGENTSGAIVNNFSAYGSTTGNDGAASYVFGNPAAWSGGYQYPSDLFIYAKGANDANGSALAADSYVDNLRKVLEQVRNTGSATGATDIILFLPFLGNFDPTRLASQYAGRVRGLADHYCAAIVNAAPNFRNSKNYGNSAGLFGVTSGGNPGAVGTDSVHISDTGAQMYADLLMQVIGS